VVFQDETGFTLHPRLGRGWAKRGEPYRVPTTSQHQQRLNLSGWVAPLLGRFAIIRTERGNREGFLQVLAHLCRRLREYTIWLYVDQAGWHKGEPVRAFLRRHPALHLGYLPHYQPGLNPEERIWRQSRYEATTNRWFESLNATYLALQSTTRAWSPKKIRRLCNMF